MPDSDQPQPPPPPPPPGEPAAPSPVNPPKETMVERGLFPGLLGGGDDEGSEPSPPPGPRNKLSKLRRSEMGFLDHLEELRMTIVKSMFAIAVGMGIVGLFFVQIFNFLRWPLIHALGPDLAQRTLISPLEVMGPVTMVMSVSIYGGAILALPVVGYYVIQFIAPGLTLREKGMLRPALWSALILFIVGVLSCFFIMLPAGLWFSYHIAQLLHFNTFWSASSYYSLVVWATMATGLVFEFPLILVILQVLGVLDPDTLRRSRRYAVIVIAVVGGLLAPSPDPGSMITMMIPMLVLYEAAIIIGARLRKRRIAAQTEAAMRDAG
jgi:sec-independent protein translocase protein TatC